MKKPFKFYSQHGEDYILWEFFKHKPKGFYIEIGAFDGVYLSNTYSFEQQGWEGICVEPNPYYFSRCQENRPKAISINVACVDKNTDSSVLFYAEEYGLLSTTDRSQEYIDDLRQRYIKRGLGEPNLSELVVESKTLDEILEEYHHAFPLDIVSIDVEGTEMQVLDGFDICKYQPMVVIVEANNDVSKEHLLVYFQQREYFCARTEGVNMFFTQKENVDVLASIKRKCVIEKQVHPKGVQFSIPEYFEGVVLNDDLKEESRKKNFEMLESKKKIEEQLAVIKSKNIVINEKEDHIQKQFMLLNQLRDELFGAKLEVKDKEVQLREKDVIIKQKEEHIQKQFMLLNQLRGELFEAKLEIKEKEVQLREKDIIIKQKEEHIQRQHEKYSSIGKDVQESKS